MSKKQKSSLKRRVNSGNLLHEAISFQQSGEVEKARYRFKKVLQSEPENASAMNFYGMLEAQHGDLHLAERLLKKSLTLDPHYADAINNLGNCLKIQGKADEAKVVYQRAHELTPDSINPMINLGGLARSSGMLEEAESWYAKALVINPDNSLALFSMAGLREKQGNYDDALVNYKKALDIDSFTPLYVHYANLLARLDKKDEAVGLYQTRVAHNPDDATAQHMLAALSGENIPERANNEYVAALFDRFATSFDQVLGNLDYKAPSLVGDLVKEFYPDSELLDVLDAGCGTGLCGEYLRPVSRKIIGIDLSAEMLRQAELCGHYDSLEKAEIIEYLVNYDSSFDLIVSADTFCYFGDMAEVGRAAIAVLNSGGRFMFTVEQHDDQMPDYILQAHGRYSHSKVYIERCLTDAGFSVLSNRQVTLRKERGEPVHGMLICAGVG